MSDKRLTNAIASNLDLLIEQKVSECLRSSGIVESNFEILTPGEAAEMVGCNKNIILDLIKDRERNDFPGSQLSPKVFAINRIEFIRWFNSGGLLAKRKQNETIETKLRAIK